MSGRFDGKIGLITGGASGLGLAIARRYVADGGRAVLGDVDADGLAKAAAELGDAVVTARCDVTDEGDQAALVRRAMEEFGRLDHVAASAGIAAANGLLHTTAQEWRRVIDIDLTGVFFTVKQAGLVMGEGGSIVTVASVNGRLPAPGMGSYNTAKAGVMMLSATAAVEFGPRGIRVNAICPGLIRTPISEGVFGSEEAMDDWYDNTPLGRHGRPPEVAALTCWLFCEDSSFITGESIGIDGGIHGRRFPQLWKIFGQTLDP